MTVFSRTGLVRQVDAAGTGKPNSMSDFNQSVTAAWVVCMGMDGPMRGADGAEDAGWHAFVSIDVGETNVESESDWCLLVGQDDEIAQAHGTIVELTFEGAV
jgi:hypothetical protein